MDTQDKKFRFVMFVMACFFICCSLGYCFIASFVVMPNVDLTTPIFGIGMLLLGYYWGTSTSSQGKDAVIKAQADASQAQAQLLQQKR